MKLHKIFVVFAHLYILIARNISGVFPNILIETYNRVLSLLSHRILVAVTLIQEIPTDRQDQEGDQIKVEGEIGRLGRFQDLDGLERGR